MPKDLFTIENIFFQLLLMVLLSLITHLGKLFWKKIMEPASAEYRPQLNLPKIKKQFLFSLFALIILFISFINGTSEYLKSILFIGMFFCVILVWGAFDAVYFFAEEKMKHHLRKEISDKSTNSSAANPDELSHKTTSR